MCVSTPSPGRILEHSLCAGRLLDCAGYRVPRDGDVHVCERGESALARATCVLEVAESNSFVGPSRNRRQHSPAAFHRTVACSSSHSALSHRSPSGVRAPEHWCSQAVDSCSVGGRTRLQYSAQLYISKITSCPRSLATAAIPAIAVSISTRSWPATSTTSTRDRTPFRESTEMSNRAEYVSEPSRYL
jgi:hypothetical protein